MQTIYSFLIRSNNKLRTEWGVYGVDEHGKRWHPMAELFEESKSPQNKLFKTLAEQKINGNGDGARPLKGNNP